MNTTAASPMPLQDRNIFRFFDLPGELRDTIYDHALIDADTEHCCLKVEGQTLALNLLAVSKRLRDEYQARATQRTNLTITLDPTSKKLCIFGQNRCKVPLPASISTISNLTLDFRLTAPLHLCFFQKWAEPVLQRQNENCKVTMEFNNLASHRPSFPTHTHANDAEKVREFLNDGFFSKAFGLVQLELYNVPMEEAGYRWNFKDRALYGSHSKDRGMVEVIDEDS